MRFFTPLFLSSALWAGFSPISCFAWGPVGHRIVAERAEAKLTHEAQRAVKELLSEESEPTLAGVANWADDAKNKQTAPLHFINFPRNDCHYTPERDCPDGKCIVAAIEKYKEKLLTPSLPKKERTKALKYLVHFVGDIHQPLHAGYADDKGGNTYQVQFQGKGTNLHKVWDSQLIQALYGDMPPLFTEVSVNIGTLSPATWAEESCQIVATQSIYPKAHKITQEYVNRIQPILETQLAIAGDRLAALLNQIFTQPPPVRNSNRR